MRKVFLVGLLFLVAGMGVAQQTMNNASVIKLIEAGLSEDLIVSTINSSPGEYNTSVESLITLKSAGVGEKTLAAIMAKATGVSTATTTVASNAAGTGLPPEVDTVGIWYKNKSGVYQEVNVEIVNFKTGGTWKAIATQGLAGGALNGNIKGTKSKLTLGTPTEFILYLPEGRSPGEYALLRLRVNKNDREFRAVSVGIVSSTGANRDMVEFTTTRIAPRAYAVTLNSDLGGGEYGFLPQHELEVGSGKSGRIYSFTLTQ